MWLYADVSNARAQHLIDAVNLEWDESAGALLVFYLFMPLMFNDGATQIYVPRLSDIWRRIVNPGPRVQYRDEIWQVGEVYMASLLSYLVGALLTCSTQWIFVPFHEIALNGSILVLGRYFIMTERSRTGYWIGEVRGSDDGDEYDLLVDPIPAVNPDVLDWPTLNGAD
jgi:hypothetical protein